MKVSILTKFIVLSSLYALSTVLVINATREYTLSTVKPITRVDTVYRDTCDSKFFKTILEIESGMLTMLKSDSNYHCKSISAEGGNGKGHLGIYDICVRGTGFHKVLGYTHDDMFDLERSTHVFWGMMGIFCHIYYAQYGRIPTYVELARMWAGGPTKHDSPATLKYKTKFEKLWLSL